MKNILVATDFSDNAKYALEMAVKLANLQKATLHLFHSIHLETYYANVPMNMMGDMTEQLRSEAKKEMAKLEKFIPDTIKLKTYIGDSMVTGELKKYIEKENIDIVIISAGGGGKLQYSLFGSTATAIVENISCLVLSVPPACEYKNFSKMIYASDLAGDEFTPLVKFAEFAKLFDADLTVLHIKTESAENGQGEKEITKLMSKVRLQTGYAKVHIQQKACSDVLEGINSYIAETHPDVFAMVIHDRSFLEKLTHVSLTKKMVHLSKIPLLILHKERASKRAGIIII